MSTSKLQAVMPQLKEGKAPREEWNSGKME
jgi:hypothetical protein